MFEQIVELALEFGIGLRRAIFTLEIEHQRHQRLGDIAATVIAEMPALVGLGAVGVGIDFGHRFPLAVAKRRSRDSFAILQSIRTADRR